MAKNNIPLAARIVTSCHRLFMRTNIE